MSFLEILRIVAVFHGWGVSMFGAYQETKRGRTLQFTAFVIIGCLFMAIGLDAAGV